MDCAGPLGGNLTNPRRDRLSQDDRSLHLAFELPLFRRFK